MSNTEIVRAWKDPEYRAILRDVPSLPIGSIELDDPYLSEAATRRKVLALRGQNTTVVCHTHLTCGCTTNCETTHYPCV